MFCSTFGGIEYRGHVQYFAFTPSSSEVAIELFCFFCVSCPEFAPTAHVHSYFRSFIVPLYFVAQGDIFPTANLETLQQSVLGSCLSRTVHSHGQYLGGLDSTDRVRMCPVPFPVLIFLPAQG